MKIKLGKLEQDIISLLKNIVREKTPNTTLRIAGGYVRDKLLGLESHDIDIAIDNMTGLEFAKLLPKHKISVIEANPEQSKHLETVQVNILGRSIDFVNLRKETYSDSRIPTIEIGTPEEDALRRDLTINALFYNINTDEVEDFTGKGLADLKNGMCRTPIDPLTTFIDDPLRVLRTIRFAAKYHFELDSKLIEAAQDESVHEAFRNKISWDRIWSEMIGQKEGDDWKKGFLTGPNPPLAIKYLADLGYRDILFRPPNVNLHPWDTEQNSKYHDLNIWEHTVSAFKYLFATSLSNDGMTPRFDTMEYAVRNLAMLLHDIGKCDCRYIQKKEDGTLSYKQHEEGSAEWAEHILNKLNAPIDVTSRVVRLVAEHMRLHTLPDKPTDKSLRKFIRDLGTDWEYSVDIAIADAYGKNMAHGDATIRARYEQFRERMKYLLETQHGQTKISRPINGHELMQKFNLKPGPVVGQYFVLLDEELLEHPDMTKQDAIEFLQQQPISPNKA